MRMNLKTLLLASAALAAVAVPALAADSYYFRTKPVVEPVRPFSFDDVAGKVPGTVVESAVARVSGYRGRTASVSGGEYQVCSSSTCSDQGSNWKSAPTTNLPADFYARVRATAPAYGQTASARLTVGDASAEFAVASRAKDTQPDTFTFASATGVEPGANAFSAPVVLSGFDGAPLSIEGGGYQVCSSTDCSDRSGQPVLTGGMTEATAGMRIRLAAAPMSFGSSATATVNVGGVTGSFTATARAKDEMPDAIAFSDKVDQTAGGDVLSEVRQLANHDGVTVSVSGTNSTLRVCSDSACGSTSTGWVSSATAAKNAYVQLRQVAPTAGQTQVATLSYGTLTTTYTVKSATVVAGACSTKTVQSSGIYPDGLLTQAPVGSEICIGNSASPSPNSNFAVVQKTGPSTYALVATESKNGGRRSLGSIGLIVSPYGLDAPCDQIPSAMKASSSQFGGLSSPYCSVESPSVQYLYVIRKNTHDAVVADDGRLLTASTSTEIVRW